MGDRVVLHCAFPPNDPPENRPRKTTERTDWCFLPLFVVCVAAVCLPFSLARLDNPTHGRRQTIAKLAKPDFEVDLSEVKDGRTRGLLEGLLDPDPKKRLRYFDSPMARIALL